MNIHRIGYVERPGERLIEGEETGNLVLVCEKPSS